MTARKIDVFFYGLFMDSTLLHEAGVSPANPRRGYVEGFALRIGRRAALVPTDASRAYGMIFALTHAELTKLYSPPGLEPYRPEAVLAHSLRGGTLPALCYNLPEAPDPSEADADYAKRLRAVLRRLDFPAAYVESVS